MSASNKHTNVELKAFGVGRLDRTELCEKSRANSGCAGGTVGKRLAERLTFNPFILKDLKPACVVLGVRDTVTNKVSTFLLGTHHPTWIVKQKI